MTSDAEPIVIQKSKAGWSGGFVAYVLLSLALAAIPAAIGAIFIASALRQQNLFVVFPTVWFALALPIVLILRARLRRRYQGTMTLWPDRLEVAEGRRTLELSFEGMEILQCDPGIDNAVLDLKDAGGRRYRSGLWPSAAADAIREVAIPLITRELEAHIARGEEVAFREYRTRYVGRLIGLAVLFAWGTMGALAVLRKDREYSVAGLSVLGLAAFFGIPLLLATLKRIRSGGAVLTKEGIRVGKTWIVWEYAVEPVTDAHGLSVRSASGLTRVASPGCANYRSLVNLVGDRIRANLSELPRLESS